MPLTPPRATEALPADDAAALRRALDGGRDVTVFVDGTVFRLPPAAREAVVDLLERFSRGDAVTVSTTGDSPEGRPSGPGEDELLNTSQAAALAGISHTYLRNMTDRGEIPVQYRGTHRRIRRGDVLAWLAAQKRRDAATPETGASA